MPLAGDRSFGEDSAVIGGLGRFQGRSVMVIGLEKAAIPETRIKHNFGMARPEGYRKARRLWNWPTVSAFPSSRWSIPRAPIPASRRKNAAKPRPSHAASIPPQSPRTLDRGHHRRRRIGRRNRAGHGQRRFDARTLHLFGDLARRLRLDPVARQTNRQDRGRSAAPDGAGPGAPGRDRWDHPRAHRRAHRAPEAAFAAVRESIDMHMNQLVRIDPASCVRAVEISFCKWAVAASSNYLGL